MFFWIRQPLFLVDEKGHGSSCEAREHKGISGVVILAALLDEKRSGRTKGHAQQNGHTPPSLRERFSRVAECHFRYQALARRFDNRRGWVALNLMRSLNDCLVSPKPRHAATSLPWARLGLKCESGTTSRSDWPVNGC